MRAPSCTPGAGLSPIRFTALFKKAEADPRPSVPRYASMALPIATPYKHTMMTPATKPPPRPRTTAERMRSYRERKQAGQVQVAINLNRTFIGDLVAPRWPTAEKRTQTLHPVGAPFLAFVPDAQDLSYETPGSQAVSLSGHRSAAGSRKSHDDTTIRASRGRSLARRGGKVRLQDGHASKERGDGNCLHIQWTIKAAMIAVPGAR